MVVCLIFEKLLRLCFSFLYICPLCVVYYLYIFIVGIYLVMNGIPMILCSISVM